MNAPFNQLKRCRHGDMLFNVNDEVIGRSLQRYGEYSEFEMQMLGRFLRPGDTVVDLGANIGAHTLYFARQVGSAGQVIAFEPQRVVFQTLCANLALNSLTNVWALQAGAGESEGLAHLPLIDYSQPDNFGAVSLDGAEQGEAVPVRTVDSLDLKACTMLKLDVEGMETAALRGAQATINRYRPMLYLENHNSHQAEALVSQLESFGYRIYWHLPALYNPENFAAEQENIFPQWMSVNILCAHRDDKEGLAAFDRLQPGPEDGVVFGSPELSRILIPFSRDQLAHLQGLTTLFDAQVEERRRQRLERQRLAS